MKAKSIKKVYIIIIFLLVIALSAFALKSYSDSLRKEGQQELYGTKNRKTAIEKIRFAQTVWPLLKSDKPYQNLLAQLNTIEQRSAVNIFLKENTSTKDINTLVSELQIIKGVKQVKFISQEEALKIYKEVNKNEPALLELIQPNILPQSVEVYLDDFTVRNQVGHIAKSKPFVTEVIQSL